MTKTRRPAMPAKGTIAKYWLEYAERGPLPWSQDGCFDYFYEPACMACHYYSEDWPVMTGKWVGAIWNEAGLERCHVIAHMNGGPSVAANLVLMCELCHKESPDMVRNPQALFEWMKIRRKCALGRPPESWLAVQGLASRITDKFPQLAEGDMPAPEFRAFLSETYAAALVDAAAARGKGDLGRREGAKHVLRADEWWDVFSLFEGRLQQRLRDGAA